MALVLALLAPMLEGYGVGLEWLVYASFILPIILLAIVWWIGSKRTV